MLICNTGSFIAEHYAETAEGILDRDTMETDDILTDGGNTYIGNIVIHMPLERARRANLLDQGIFSLFGINLSEYDLEQEISLWGTKQ